MIWYKYYDCLYDDNKKEDIFCIDWECKCCIVSSGSSSSSGRIGRCIASMMRRSTLTTYCWVLHVGNVILALCCCGLGCCWQDTGTRTVVSEWLRIEIHEKCEWKKEHMRHVRTWLEGSKIFFSHFSLSRLKNDDERLIWRQNLFLYDTYYVQ